MKPIIDCQKCKGSGKVEMSDEMFHTLKAVGRKSTVEQVLKKLAWKGHQTAINNRLEYLRQLGFITRSRIGREWLYSKA